MINKFEPDKNNLVKLDDHFLYVDPDEGSYEDYINKWSITYDEGGDDSGCLIELYSEEYGEESPYIIPLNDYLKRENVGVTRINNVIYIIDRLLDHRSCKYKEVPKKVLSAIPKEKYDYIFSVNIHALTMFSERAAKDVDKLCRKYDLSYHVADKLYE